MERGHDIPPHDLTRNRDPIAREDPFEDCKLARTCSSPESDVVRIAPTKEEDLTISNVKISIEFEIVSRDVDFIFFQLHQSSSREILTMNTPSSRDITPTPEGIDRDRLIDSIDNYLTGPACSRITSSILDTDGNVLEGFEILDTINQISDLDG
ncbi:MAG: hypothetical protein QUS07_07420 [Methanothrix sp.]|nr:hypothetical protein [Methanothrix sp.]